MDDDTPSGDGRINPTSIPETTTIVASETQPKAWELFLLFIFCCLAIILFLRYMLKKCCKTVPPPNTMEPAGAYLNRVNLNSLNRPNDDLELNLLELNDNTENGEEVVVARTREAKIK